MATTTPVRPACEPLADPLGFDDVVATRYGGRRPTALRRHARRPVRVVGRQAAGRPGVGGRPRRRPAESWAYCDSFYDAPLLSAVGHPVAVNPDPRLRRARPRCAAGRCCTSTCRRAWPSCRSSDSSRSGSCSSWPVRPLFPYARFDIAGVEHLPEDGPAIVVGNHRSYFDVAAMAVALAKRGRPSASSARRRCSTPRSSASSRRPWAASASSAAPARDEPLAAADGRARLPARSWR